MSLKRWSVPVLISEHFAKSPAKYRHFVVHSVCLGQRLLTVFSLSGILNAASCIYPTGDYVIGADSLEKGRANEAA